MATSDIDVCNSALILLGAQLISSLTTAEASESDQVETLARIYPPFRLARLTEHPWAWASVKRQLSRLAAAPANEWTYQFQIPAECLRLNAVFDSGQVGARPHLEFDRVGSVVMTDAPVLYIDMIEDQDERDWPRLFEEYAANALAAQIAVAITGKISLAEHYRENAYGLPQERGEGGMYAKVKAWDAQQHPPEQIGEWSLIEARFGTVTVDHKLR